MSFKTNTNGHKHPISSLLMIVLNTISETKDNNKWHSTQQPLSPQKQSYRLWLGAAPPMMLRIYGLVAHVCVCKPVLNGPDTGLASLRHKQFTTSTQTFVSIVFIPW